jgi:excisionase family DNA binding protein
MEETSPHTDKREEFLTARQLAKLMQVSESTVRRLAREGRIPSVRLTPRLLRFHLSAVMNALDGTQTKTRTRRPTPPHGGATDETQLSFEDMM